MSTETSLFDEPWARSTTSFPSGFGAPVRAPLNVILVSGALAVSGTSSDEPNRVWQAPFVDAADATGSSLGWEDAQATKLDSTRKAVSELRRISGFTWGQLGQLFEVSRRSVHFWASGKPLNADNEERLMLVLDVVRAGYRGSARDTRAALLDSTEGTSPFDMLIAQRFDEARSALGQGTARARVGLTELSREARAARAPLPLDELYDAKSERIHKDPGRARPVRTARNKRRGST